MLMFDREFILNDVINHMSAIASSTTPFICTSNFIYTVYTKLHIECGENVPDFVPVYSVNKI